MKSIATKICLFLLIAFLAGCGSKNITINISSTPETNERRLFYVVVRSVEEKAFLVEGYQTIASKTLQAPPDKSVLASEPIYPGQDREIIVKKPENKAIAVYFLFTNPGDKWKLLVPKPLPSDYEIGLDGNQIVEHE